MSYQEVLYTLCQVRVTLLTATSASRERDDAHRGDAARQNIKRNKNFTNMSLFAHTI